MDHEVMNPEIEALDCVYEKPDTLTDTKWKSVV